MDTILAKYFTRGRTKPIRLIVMHSMEVPKQSGIAGNVARNFQRDGANASAHICVDNTTLVRSVLDSDTAWAAPGVNSEALHVELAGYARQNFAEWTDDFGLKMLRLAAAQCAAWCVTYDITIKRLSPAQLLAGEKGFTGHVDVTNAYKQGSHTDPGNGFPWDMFLAMVTEAMPNYLPKIVSKPVTVPAPVAPKPNWIVAGPITGLYLVKDGKARYITNLLVKRQSLNTVEDMWLVNHLPFLSDYPVEGVRAIPTVNAVPATEVR